MTASAARGTGTRLAAPGVRRGRTGRVISALLTIAVLATGVAAVLIVVVPRVIGGGALTVLTGSMQPTLNPGDVVVVRPVDPVRDLQVGDVITFQPISGDPTLITHRVVGTSGATTGAKFITRGDANGADDEPVRAEQIRGKMWFRVPWVGYASIWLGDNRQLVMTVAGVGLLGYAGASLVGWVGSRRPRRGVDA